MVPLSQLNGFKYSRTFNGFTFYVSLKKNINYMENNFEIANAVVYAWINLSVGKKQNCTTGSEEGCKS